MSQQKTIGRAEYARKFAWARLARRIRQCRDDLQLVAGDYGDATIDDWHMLSEQSEALDEAVTDSMLRELQRRSGE